MSVNARILPFNAASQPSGKEVFLLGFQYLENGKWQRFLWETRYESLEKIPALSLKTGPYGWKIHQFKGPVRLGALEMDGFSFNAADVNPQFPIRGDVPVEQYYFQTRLGPDGDANFWQLKSLFTELFGPPDPGGREEKHENSLKWTVDGIEFWIIYWYKTAYRAESGYAALNITNNRVYPEYLGDSYCTETLPQVKTLDIQTFEAPRLQNHLNYRYCRRLRFTPARICDMMAERDHHYAVWIDREHRKIGFATQTYALIADWADISHLTLWNYEGDRGSKEADLNLHYIDENHDTLAAAQWGDLDSIFQMIVQSSLIKTEYKED